MARAKPTTQAACEWPAKTVEAIRTLLNNNRARWPEIAKRSCVGERYLRAFARKQIYCPPYDRFVLIQRALEEIKAR